MLKRGLKGLGFLLIAIGVFIIIIQPMSTTGAVIDLSTAISRIWFFIGLGIILGGVVLVALRREEILEEILGEPIPIRGLNRVKETIDKYEDDPNKVALVIDTSAAIRYWNKDRQKFIDFITDYKKTGAKIIVSEQNLKELGEYKNTRLRNFLSTNTDRPDSDYKQYRNIAKRFLKMTPKHIDALDVIPYLKNPKKLDKIDPDEKEIIQKEIDDIINVIAKQEEIDPKYVNASYEKMYDLIMKHGLVGKGDIGALSSGIYENTERETFIFGRDMHLRQAIQSLKERDKKLTGSLHYLPFY